MWRGITLACNHRDNNGENLWPVIIHLLHLSYNQISVWPNTSFKKNTNMSYSLHKSCFIMSAPLMQYICQALLKFFLMYILAHKPLQWTDIASGTVLVTLNLWRWDNKREILQTCKFSLWHHAACKVSCQHSKRAFACASHYSTTIVQTLFHRTSW